MRIETERLVLRDFAIGDWLDVLAYQREPLYLRYYPWKDRTEADVRQFVQTFVDWQAEEPRRRWQHAVTLRHGGPVIGNAGIRRKAENDFEADVGYELGPQHWGKGYATEAVRALMRFGFDELGLHRVSSWCIADNASSARVLERLGMRQEGRLRENEYYKGRYWDTLLYGLLREEWVASPQA